MSNVEEKFIRVAIVDDSQEWIKIITRKLTEEDDFLISWSATSAKEAVNMARHCLSDVILFDINMNGDHLSGIQALRDISEFSEARLIIVSSMTDHESLTEAICSSAEYFIQKEDLTHLCSKIRKSLYQGDLILKAAREEIMMHKKGAVLGKLSQSEMEIYHLLEIGHKRKQIADILSKSEETIKSHIKSILLKLQCRSTKEAVKKIGIL